MHPDMILFNIWGHPLSHWALFWHIGNCPHPDPRFFVLSHSYNSMCISSVIAQIKVNLVSLCDTFTWFNNMSFLGNGNVSLGYQSLFNGWWRCMSNASFLSQIGHTGLALNSQLVIDFFPLHPPASLGSPSGTKISQSWIKTMAD